MSGNLTNDSSTKRPVPDTIEYSTGKLNLFNSQSSVLELSHKEEKKNEKSYCSSMSINSVDAGSDFLLGLNSESWLIDDEKFSWEDSLPENDFRGDIHDS